jgi:hypothetical protein
LRKTSVNGSENVPGWVSWKTLVSVTAYHSFGGEVEALNTLPTAFTPLDWHIHEMLYGYVAAIARAGFGPPLGAASRARNREKNG